MQEIKAVVDKNSKIAVLCGGMSSEAEVSMRSGKGCYDALQRLGYKNSEMVFVDKDIALKLKEGNYDYAFNALHGKYGEDGCIQGILEILRIPYTGCGVMASSLCMNKEFTKRILSTNPDIIMAKSAFVKKGDDLFEKTKGLTYPLFVKPVSEGSSFGMTKVDKKEDLKSAYETALKYNDDVLIELAEHRGRKKRGRHPKGEQPGALCDLPAAVEHPGVDKHPVPLFQSGVRGVG